MNTNNSFLRVAAAVGTIAGSATAVLVSVAAGLNEAPVVAGAAGAVALVLGYATVRLFAGTREAIRNGDFVLEPNLEVIDGYLQAPLINPATGLMMVGGVDTGGNAFGCAPLHLPPLPRA